MNMKRRVVYLTDDEWAVLQHESGERGQTISSLVRDWLRDAWTTAPPARVGGPVAPISTTAAVFPAGGATSSSVTVTQADVTDASHPARRPAAESDPQRVQRERDALLHGINRPPRR